VDDWVRRDQNPGRPLVSVIIPSWGRPRELQQCVTSVIGSSYRPLEIIVVDSQRDGAFASAGLDSQNAPVRVCRFPTRLYTSQARNEGIAVATGQILFFLDSDNILPPDSISRLAQVLMRDGSVGFVGPVTYYKYDPARVWSAGAHKSRFLRRHKTMLSVPVGQTLYEADILPNAFMTRRDVLDVTGTFDSLNFTIQEDETELQLRARRRGFRTVVLASAATYHDIEPSPAAHLSSEMLREAFRGRFWIEKKHDRRNVPGFGFFTLLLLPYYFLLASQAFLETRKESPLAVLSVALRGIAEGLLREPG
jgi:GT2 family glycosyltransferase